MKTISSRKRKMIIGHESQKQYFIKALARGLSHAYLFYGPEHIGKLTFAKTLAKTLFCKNATSGLGKECGVCADCVQIEKDAHPSVVVLDLEHTLMSEKDERKNIPIEDISELKRLFAYAPGTGWRIAIINEAEKMSRDAASSFLKLLEEPCENSLFILISPSREILFSTIVSRAVPIRFSPSSVVAMGEYLAVKVRDEDKEKAILNLSFGRPGIMLRLIEDKVFFAEEEKKIRDFESALKKGVPELLRISSAVAGNPKEARKFGEFLVKSLRESLLSGERDKHRIDTIKWLTNTLSLLESTNINPRLALDAMSIRASEVLG